MKISELIRGLEYTKNEYGDLEVSLTVEHEGKLFYDDDIFIGYEQYENSNDEINLRNFPY